MLLGEDGAAAGARESTLFVDMSTIAPADARADSAERCAERGHAFVDAPVTGSSPKAEDGTLTIMAGGSRGGHRSARARCSRSMGEKIVALRRGRARARPVKVLSKPSRAVNCATLAQALVRRRARPASTSTRC